MSQRGFPRFAGSRRRRGRKLWIATASPRARVPARATPGSFRRFLSAARRCFELIDKDGGGTLSTDEIVRAVKEDQEARVGVRDSRRGDARGGRRGDAAAAVAVPG